MSLSPSTISPSNPQLLPYRCNALGLQQARRSVKATRDVTWSAEVPAGHYNFVVEVDPGDAKGAYRLFRSEFVFRGRAGWPLDLARPGGTRSGCFAIVESDSRRQFVHRVVYELPPEVS